MLEQEENSRTKPTLENILRMSFHPKGCYEFMGDVNKELELSPSQSAIDNTIARMVDISKYLVYLSALTNIGYELLK